MLVDDPVHDGHGHRREAVPQRTELEEVDALLVAQTESEKDMLDYVLTFSELFKSASALYKQATDLERRELAHLVFSELTLINGNIATYSAKEEFAILLNRPKVACGGTDPTSRCGATRGLEEIIGFFGLFDFISFWRDRRDSNPRPLP